MKLSSKEIVGCFHRQKAFVFFFDDLWLFVPLLVVLNLLVPKIRLLRDRKMIVALLLRYVSLHTAIWCANSDPHMHELA